MNCLNENNKEAKIYGKDSESCERLEQDEIRVWSDRERVCRGVRFGIDVEGLFYSKMQMGGIRVYQELERKSTNIQKHEYAFYDLRMVRGNYPAVRHCN